MKRVLVIFWIFIRVWNSIGIWEFVVCAYHVTHVRLQGNLTPFISKIALEYCWNSNKFTQNLHGF